MKIRTQLKAGGRNLNHNETLQVRSALKAGGLRLNHNETLQVRSALKAGGLTANHNEALKDRAALKALDIRWTLKPVARKTDRLELMVVRAGLRAGISRDRSLMKRARY
jgi:hypothetical protein